ncbi:hypothetical protein EJP77_00360 [Paenibacillus zeisoli]|uniref:WD40 repeat domain-containing protein n=1 Tax=Paenibacillus zeisoli TaxID=2496267 RepID=A0A433XN23_9BACL|nr:hypothetical protein [Paenibacillus zeisoli]RUT35517.1 hypothetical protein EJP77_00360 [Paenibacillus zeisoli]
MRFYFSTAAIILTLSAVIGCTHEGSPPIAEADELQIPAHEQHAVNKTASQGSSHLDKEFYDIREVSQVQIQDHTQISWQEEGVSLTALAVQNDQLGASTQVSSISITQDNIDHPIEFEVAPASISSVSLSADHQYLALHLKYNEGHRLVIINMTAGNYYTLNDYLSRNGRGSVDTIHSYQWAPKGNHLALAYGDETRSSVAIYQPDKKMLLDIPTSVLYEDTPVIVWHKRGKGFDFVSAKDNDIYVLNRYIRGKSLVSQVKVIERDEVADLRSISPTYAK